MADNRSKRQKLEAMAAPNSGATDGERDNALAILSRLFGEAVGGGPQEVALWAGQRFVRVGSRTYVLEVRTVTRGPAYGSLYLFCPCPAWRYAMGRGDVCKHAKDVLATEIRGHKVGMGAVLS
jgi:hypothetical protein